MGTSRVINDLLALPDMTDCRSSKCDGEEDWCYFIRSVDVKTSLN